MPLVDCLFDSCMTQISAPVRSQARVEQQDVRAQWVRLKCALQMEGGTHRYSYVTGSDCGLQLLSSEYYGNE